MALFQEATFYRSAASLGDLPPASIAEIAFVGRSNVGKSSVINTLTGQRKLARVSRTPGRTRLINLFALGHDRYLVDLPGYGYAKVAAALRSPWEQLLGEYLLQRGPLRGLVLVMDIRHPVTSLDQTLLHWFAPVGKPVHVLLNKSDKLARGPALAVLRDVKQRLAALSAHYSVQLFSSLKRTGLEPAEQLFDLWLR